MTLILAQLQFSSLDRDLEDDMEQASHIHLHSLFGMTALCAPCYWHISAWYVTHATGSASGTSVMHTVPSGVQTLMAP